MNENTSENKTALVVLSGCGYLDGAEIHESVITLLALSRAGVDVTVAAPNKPQHHVVDHGTGEEVAGETRNVLTEANRIARGGAVALDSVDANGFDGVFLPGGFGAAKNLSNLAFKGPDGSCDPDVVRVLSAFHSSGKPIGAVCISPAVLVMALGKGSVTIGNDAGTAGAIAALGGSHVDCPVDELTIDGENKIVSAPAYMYDAPIHAVAAGIDKAVSAFVEML